MYGNTKQHDFLWGALVGGSVAALTALLFTTKKGKEIQRQIGDAYHELENSIKNTASQAKDKVEQAKDKVENMAEDMGKKIVNKVKPDEFFKDSK